MTLIESLARDPRFIATPEGGAIVSRNPATGEALGAVKPDNERTLEATLGASLEAFDRWRRVPAPERGRVVRAVGDALRSNQAELGSLIAREVGKIRAEGVGEVQETLDIADFALGLSRSLGGRTIPSERRDHRIFEQWLPLGPIGVITAFNFPHAVWGWNAMLAAVCGDVTIWKPSPLAPLTALATHLIAEEAAAGLGHRGLFPVVFAKDTALAEKLVRDRRVPLISATGSCAMGRRVGELVAARLGRSLLELGGNNAVIVEPDADRALAARAVVFGAVGTGGQRCTTTRRLIVHESIEEEFTRRLVRAYRSIRIGDPLDPETHVGPLISAAAVEGFERAIAAARRQGGEVLCGGGRVKLGGPLAGGNFVEPTIVRVPATNELPIAREETFAPILYVYRYRELGEAIATNNAVGQGLSSAIFAGSQRAGERFLSPDGTGSDCGLAYVNLGTSGAEVGGAFGGEKDTGGGRESGSDSWKAYMRRQTCTVNFGEAFALAQGIRFE